jgi:hypothetical protein
MDIRGSLQSAWSTFIDKLNEQQWFIQLKQKWEELDEQSRFYLKIASLGAAALFVIILVTSSIWSVRELRNNYRDKIALLNMLQNVTDEMRQLKNITSTATQQAGVPQPWNAYFESILPQVGVDKNKLSISPEKPVSTKNTDPMAPKESMFEISVREINVKQLIKLAYQLENGMRPVKLRNMWVDTRGEHSGWLDAKLTVSAFTIPSPK